MGIGSWIIKYKELVPDRIEARKKVKAVAEVHVMDNIQKTVNKTENTISDIRASDIVQWCNTTTTTMILFTLNN